MNKSYTSYQNIGKFINNINGNFRNCLYITCSVCKNKKDFCNGDMLVSFDEAGAPVFISVTDANYIFATLIDKSECLGEISNAKFLNLFEEFFRKHTNSEDGCPFQQLTKSREENNTELS